MGRLAESIGKDGRVRLHYDEVQIVRKALRKLLFSKDEEHTPAEEMSVILIYQKLIYKDGERLKNKNNKVNSGNNKG